MSADAFFDECVGRLDFEPFRTPPELVPGRGISLANQANPKAVFGSGKNQLGANGQARVVSGLLHSIQRLLDPVGNHRILHQGVGGDDVDGLFQLFLIQLRQRHPNQLGDGGRIFATAVSNHPRDRVQSIQRFQFFDALLNRSFESCFRKSGLPIAGIMKQGCFPFGLLRGHVLRR